LEKLLNLPNAQKFLLFLAVSLLVDASVYFLLVNEAESQVKQTKMTLVRRQTELSNMKKQFNENVLVELEKVTSEMQAGVAENEKLLPTRDEVASFLLRIKSHADTSGLNVKRFEKLDKEYKARYATIPIRMEVKGNIVQLVRFFRTLAQPYERLVRISELVINFQAPSATGLTESVSEQESLDLSNARNMLGKLDTSSLDPEVVTRLEKILDLDMIARYGRVRATFVLEAFTFLTSGEGGK
jgi:Tfp pilus assembly protein PilO